MTTQREISDPLRLHAEPLVSVCMVTYNHSPFLCEAVAGVIGQRTSFPVELLIGEDCSKDGTRALAEELQRRHPETIRLIVDEHNVGMQRNSLRLEDACRGRFIAYCQGDDFWCHPDKLQMQVDLLERHPDCALVHGDYDIRIESQGVVVPSPNTRRNRQDLPAGTDVFSEILLSRYEIATCTVCVRTGALRQAVDRVRPILEDPATKQGDLPRWLPIARSSGIRYLPERLATYRVLGESASHTRNKLGQLEFLRSSKGVRFRMARDLGAPVPVRDEAERRLLAVMLRQAYETGDGVQARSAAGRLAELGRPLSGEQRVMLWGARWPAVKALVEPAVKLARGRKERANAARLTGGGDSD